MAERFAHARAQEIVAPVGFANSHRRRLAILSNVSKSQSSSPRVTLQKFCRDNLAEELHSGMFYWKLSRSRRHRRPSGTARALKLFCVVWSALSIEVRKGQVQSAVRICTSRLDSGGRSDSGSLRVRSSAKVQQ
jgi:hypothetical protein